MRQTFEGAEAWRNGFSRNAADLLQIIRTFSTWTDVDFKQALVKCAKRARGERVKVSTVEQVLLEMQPETDL